MSVTMESLAERLAEKGMISPKDGQSASGFGGEVDPDQSPSGETDRGQPAVGESQNPAQLKEGESPGPSDEGENPDGQEGQTSGESSTEVKIETIADLAGYLEVEPDFIYGLKIKLSESGEPVPLGEIKDKLQEYQRQAGDIEREKANLEAERQNWLQQLQQVQQYGGQLSEREQQAQAQMAAAKAEFDRINWDELEKLDPGRAALDQQKLLRKFNIAKHQLTEAQQERQQMQQGMFQQYKAEQDRLLLDRVPEWRDSDRAMKDIHGILSWMQERYRFTSDEINQAVDWRHRDVLRKAFLYDQMQGEKRRTLSKPPKPLRTTAGTRVNPDRKANLARVVQEAKRGNRDDKQAAATQVLLSAMSRK
jgi:hypothetical protein